MKRVPTDKLVLFVNGDYHWQNLQPHDQKAMAAELIEWRFHAEGMMGTIPPDIGPRSFGVKKTPQAWPIKQDS